MQKRIWSQYNRELVNRGRITFLIDQKVLTSIESFRPKSQGGRPQQFPEKLIELLLVVKIHYHLSYRCLEGFAKSLFHLIGTSFSLPTYTTICKRAKYLASTVEKLSNRRPSVILIDSTGVKVYGEGEWKRKIHGPGRPRKWVKIHIAVDEMTQEIVATELTPSTTADCAFVETLLKRVSKRTKKVKADGAYDGKQTRKFFKSRGINCCIPPPKNARADSGDEERDSTVREILGLGGGKRGRSLWGKLSGYSLRALVETAFSRYKRLFGGRLFSKTIERQRVENYLKWKVLNMMMKAA